jgi:hypothetical protein
MSKRINTILVTLASKILLPMLRQKLQDPTVREQVVRWVNRKIDLPVMDEKQEQRLFASLFDSFTQLVKIIINA